jgi:hypothetical protein
MLLIMTSTAAGPTPVTLWVRVAHDIYEPRRVLYLINRHTPTGPHPVRPRRHVERPLTIPHD